MNKYNAQKTTVDGITFDSKKEAERYSILKLREKNGEISDLELQPKFILLEPFEVEHIQKGVKKFRGINYVADFKYNVDGWERPWVEDVKGMKTDIYKIKKKMFLSKYSDKFVFIET